MFYLSFIVMSRMLQVKIHVTNAIVKQKNNF